VDALVHPSAQKDALTAARHRTFIAPRLLGSLAVLASFPVYIVVRGVPTALEVGVFAWFGAPILIVYFLSRTGRHESSHALSALALIGLAAVVAIYTGGIASFAAIWLVVVPLEAALSISRRIIALAAGCALAVSGLLLVLDVGGLLPHAVINAEQQSTLAGLSIISAMLYAAGLGLGAELFMRTSVSLLHAEEDRYRLLTRLITDVIMIHGRNGSVLSVPRTAEPMIGVQASELLGNGLFDRLHVVDRPAYLTALADAASLNEERSLELRIRRGDGKFLWAEMRCLPRGLWYRRARGRGRAPRHQRTKVTGARDRDCAFGVRTCRRGENPVYRHHESRAPHATERNYRLLRHADE